MRTPPTLSLLVALACALSACGPSGATIDKLVQEKQILEERVKTLESELDELRSGGARRLGEAQHAFHAGDFTKTISIAEELGRLHPNTSESTQATALANQARERLDEVTRLRAAEAEAERRDRERSTRDRVRDVVRVQRVWTDRPNSAGGVDLNIVWQNRSAKTVKYAYFTLVPYNAVGDAVACSIRDYSEYTAEVTGPIRPGQTYGGGMPWENAWYNNTIKRARVEQIRIVYTDSTWVRFSEDEARFALD